MGDNEKIIKLLEDIKRNIPQDNSDNMEELLKQILKELKEIKSTLDVVQINTDKS